MNKIKELAVYSMFLPSLFLMIGFGIYFNQTTDKEDRVEMILRSEPIVTNWLPEKTFEVAYPVERVDDLEMGRVILKRTEDGQLFSAMVIPIREIPVGSTVKIVEVRYIHHPLMQKNFMMVR